MLPVAPCDAGHGTESEGGERKDTRGVTSHLIWNDIGAPVPRPRGGNHVLRIHLLKYFVAASAAPSPVVISSQLVGIDTSGVSGRSLPLFSMSTMGVVHSWPKLDQPNARPKMGPRGSDLGDIMFPSRRNL